MRDADSLKYLSIHLDETGKKIMACFAPEGAIEGDGITVGDLRQAIGAAGFGGGNLDEPALITATEKYNLSKAFEISVGEVLDGKFSIRIDDGQMGAYFSCTLPRGGAPVQMDSVLQEAERKNISVKLNLEAIEKTLKEGGDNVLIASAKAPVPGIDGKVEVLIPNMSNRSPHLDENGLADFRDLGEMLTVHNGDALMRRIPPTSGEPGITLSGKAIPAKPGKEVPFAAKLSGAILDPKDHNLLIAAIDGLPVLKNSEISIEPIYTVDNVDLHTGNVSFKGTVHVKGDVQTGMSIKASGDINVDGTVEGATLDAGGDIEVKGGILGESEQGDKPHSEIKCGGTCTARFVQNAHITAGNGIFIHDFSMQSELSAGHQIVVGDKSHKGNIIGGVTRAAMLVHAHIIGADNFVKTIVIAGAAQVLHERLKAVVETREAAEHKFSDIIRILEVARLNPGRVPPDTVKAAEATRDAIKPEIEALRADERELQNEIDLAKEAKVVAEKRVFAGVEVLFGLQRYKVVADRQNGVFYLKDGELIFE